MNKAIVIGLIIAYPLILAIIAIALEPLAHPNRARKRGRVWTGH